MPDKSPASRRASRSVRIGALAIVLAALAIGARSVVVSLAWVEQEVFPGFLLLPNELVAAVDLGWSRGGVPYGSRVVEVAGMAVATRGDVYAHAGSLQAGSPVRYRLRLGAEERDVTVPTEHFGRLTWVLVFGPFLLNGLVFLACGLVVWVLRPHTELGQALLALGAAAALFFLSAPEIYGPGRSLLMGLHLGGLALLPAAALHLTLLFPRPLPAVHAARIGYALAAVLFAALVASLHRPPLFAAAVATSTALLAGASMLFVGRLIAEWRRGPSQLARQQARIVALGALGGLALPGGLVVAATLAPGRVPLSPGALTPFLLALALLHALVKRDLFEIDAAVKRGAYYLVLAGAVGALYLGAFLVLNLVLKARAVTDSPAFPVFFTLAVLLLFNPLRSRLQALVDRVFFRTRYDAAQVLAAVGGELAATLQRDRIAALVCAAADGAIPNARTRLFVASPHGALADARHGDVLPPVLERELARGHVLTAFDPVEQYADAGVHAAVRGALAGLDAEIAVPLQLRDELAGALTAGRKRSGLFYAAGDAEFLRALAHQAAIALENARSYEALVALNARLEERVRERTAQLEGANRELGLASDELRSAEVQLVHSEKMASLGRLVASVAHEINNPVSFIATSVTPLRRRLESAAAAAPPEVAKVLREAEEIVAVMARGAERTAAIVRDLRSFSRLGEATRRSTDLHAGLEASLRLLESRWRDRITVHRDYGRLPLVACDPAQVNQVFFHVLANACDAVGDGGNVWLATRVEGDLVTITVRDDGAGMPPEVLGRVFDPFFTTKDVGRGTGLGLAISHGVVTAHGGRIEAESSPGAGATFRIILPVGDAASLDRAASGSR